MKTIILLFITFLSHSFITTAHSLSPRDVAQDIVTMTERRYSVIVGQTTTGASSIANWMASQQSDGSWMDVDYTTGCSARRASWPASAHWSRIVAMAAAYHGGLDGAALYANSAALLSAISRGMDWWFTRDMKDLACLDQGGLAGCPCDPNDTTMWNTNWYSNIILIPQFVEKACLLLGQSALSQSQITSCKNFGYRSYQQFYRQIYNVGTLTGANLMDVAGISIDVGLFSTNASVIADAYNRVHNDMVIQNAIKSDGIRADGSFGQHGGLIYNGNYGRVYFGDVLDLEIIATDTQFSASSTPRKTLETALDGSRWMIFASPTNILRWDFSVLGRMLSFPVADNQSSATIFLNLTEIQSLGNSWNSTALKSFASSLSKTVNSANAGSLVGNRMFYADDYMVHRGSNYVSSLRMYSARTVNSECINTQNPFGFHLSDGTMYTYIRGDEYEDIQAAWDWNSIPGITTDYGNTPLSCATTTASAPDKYVGGVSNGTVGIAAMRYGNPINKALRFQKTWFFLDGDVQFVMVNNISSTSSAPIFSVLDQKRRNGAVFVNGTDRSITLSSSTSAVSFPRATTLWHAGIGYGFDAASSATLNVQVGVRTGSWSTIGTSTQTAASVDLFKSYLQHPSTSTRPPITYSIFPGTTSASAFNTKYSQRSSSLQPASNTNLITALYDATYNKAYAVFWDVKGGTVKFNIPGFNITSNGKAAVMYNRATGYLTVSEPSQSSSGVTISVSKGATTKSVTATYPQGGLAGGSVTKRLPCCYYP